MNTLILVKHLNVLDICIKNINMKLKKEIFIFKYLNAIF